ncbi:MAG: carotenoid biosynthesis protein [Chloroflexi bacterium]|nr:carotenoid biosynthesis protein [Chloroflexota bacterium]
MMNIYFTTIELMVLALTIMAVQHAWQRGAHVVWQLVAGMVFGVLLEIATIQQLEAYVYGRFNIMIFDVPIVIGVSWGLIIYSARLFSDATNLPTWARPILDGLLALNIDIAMDVIAVRLGMWDWGNGLSNQYFGIPWANFWAWFWVVTSFSAAIRILARPNNWFGRWAAPFLAIVIGTLAVLGTNALIVFILHPAGLYEVSVAVVIVGALLLILALRPKLRVNEVAMVGTAVPLAFHLYFLLAGLVSGALFNPSFLLLISILMLVIAWFVHKPRVHSK